MALHGMLMQRLEQGVTRAWYGGAWWLWLLWPLSLAVSWVVARRRRRFLNAPPATLVKPVVVVGGITVGGSGENAGHPGVDSGIERKRQNSGRGEPGVR